MWWNFNKRKERRASMVPTAEQRAVFDEATQSLRERLPIERVVFYEPDEEDIAKDPSTLHIAMITDHYPSHEEYRAALDALRPSRTWPSRIGIREIIKWLVPSA